MTEKRVSGAENSGRRSRLRWGAGAALLSLALMSCGGQVSVPATTAEVQLEAEQGSIQAVTTPQTVADPRNGGRIINDPTASGGKAVILLGTNDNVRFVVPSSFKPGRYTVSVRGRGENYQGWPTVDLNDARQRRLAVATLDSATYVTRQFGDFDLKPGQVFNLSFINDLYEGRGKDRNAIVDYLVFEPVGTSPTPPSRAASFVSQFGTDGFDTAYDVAVDAGGNSYVVGDTTGSFPGQTKTGNSNAFLRKVGPQGQELWLRQFGPATLNGAYNYTALFNVAVDRTGNVYVAGDVDGTLAGQTGAGGLDAFVRKYAPDGTEVWTRQFGTAGSDVPVGLGVDGGGNVYVVGVSPSILSGAQGYDGPTGDPGSPAVTFVRKYTADGAEGWTRQFAAVGKDPSSGQPLPVSPAQGAGVDAAGNVYVVGSTRAALPGQTQVGYEDAYLRKYTPNGAEAWTRQFGASAGAGSTTAGSGVAVDADGNSYVVGTTSGVLPGPDSTGSASSFLAKSGPDGGAIWTRQFGTSNGSGLTGLSNVAVNGAGDVFVAGGTSDIFPGQLSAGGEDTLVLKYGADGRALAARQLGSAGTDQPLGLAADADGVYLAGRTDGTFPGQTSAGSYDALLIKFGSSLGAVTPPPTINQSPIITFRVDNGLRGKSASPYTSTNVFEVDNNLKFEADASDVDGSVARVEFYSGSRKIGEDTTAPYSLVLSNENNYIEDSPRGDGSIFAVAVDNQGATTSSAPSGILQVSSTFGSPELRGIDLGGKASSYLNFTLFEPDGGGFTTNGTPTVLGAGVPLVPPVKDPAREALIRSSVSRQGTLELNVPAPNGTYAVYLWVRADDATPYDIQMEGQTVAHFAAGEAGRWDRLGPFEVNVGGGVLNVASTGTARANFSAIEYARLPRAGDTLPTVKFTGDLANGNPPADGRVSADASSTTGRVVKVEFFLRDLFGSSDPRRLPLTKIGEATQPPYSVVWKNSPLSFQRVTAVVTDDTGARNSATVTTGPLQSTP